MQRLSQQQTLLQKLSPQQIQLMKLLQVPTLLLDERIKEEIEENPALELDVEDFDEKTLSEKTNDEVDEFSTDNNEEYENEEEYGNIDIAEYVKEGDDEDADYNFQKDVYTNGDDDGTFSFQPKFETTFYDHLLAQVNMLNLEKPLLKVAEFVIGSIDEDGYLRRDIPSIIDDLSFKQNIVVTETELKEVIKLIQEFDPTGVCAKDLQECLLLQLRKKEKNKIVNHAIKIIDKFFEEFIKKHYEKIQRSLVLSDSDLKEVIQLIVKLNPKPGAIYEVTNKAATFVLPDFFVQNINGELELSLNQKNAPDLRVSSSFRDMLKDYDKGKQKDERQKEALLFIKQKIDAAKWFIDAIKQRQETLLLTMGRIMHLQEEFFLTGDESALRPMILKDVSDRTGLDISTISRVVNSKYVQTEFGTYKLKYFFSESMSTDSGEDVSTREVKIYLNEIINAESKKQPLSDEKLTDLLNEKGYNIARRTVAKYREQLNHPVARLRKQI